MKQTATVKEPIRLRVNRAEITLRQDDLTALAVDAVVFYAKENLELGTGFGTAIQNRGGDSIKKELVQIGSIGMGEAIITGAGQLKPRHIIHACGPKFQEEDTEGKLRECILSALRLADEKELKTVAFPPMGAGFYGIPLELCATVMLSTIKGYLQEETSLQEIIICVIDGREFDAFRAKVAGI